MSFLFEKIKLLLVGQVGQGGQVAQVSDITSFTTMEGYTILIYKSTEMKSVESKRSYRDVLVASTHMKKT